MFRESRGGIIITIEGEGRNFEFTVPAFVRPAIRAELARWIGALDAVSAASCENRETIFYALKSGREGDAAKVASTVADLVDSFRLK